MYVQCIGLTINRTKVKILMILLLYTSPCLTIPQVIRLYAWYGWNNMHQYRIVYINCLVLGLVFAGTNYINNNVLCHKVAVVTKIINFILNVFFQACNCTYVTQFAKTQHNDACWNFQYKAIIKLSAKVHFTRKSVLIK